jgi:hypothetical protein
MNSICINNIIIFIKIYNINIKNRIICAINIIILFIINSMNTKYIMICGMNIRIFIISNNIIITMRSGNLAFGLPLHHVALG